VKEQEYAWLSPYQYASNSPVKFVDLLGLQAGQREVPKASPELSAATDEDVSKHLEAMGKASKKVFFGSAEVGGVGIGAGVTVGPVRLGAEANLAAGEFGIDASETKFTGKVGQVGGQVQMGGLQLEGEINLAEGSFKSDYSEVKTEGQFVTGEGKAEGETDNLTVDNAARLGISGKVGPFKIRGGINFGQLGKTILHAVAAAAEFTIAKVKGHSEKVQKQVEKEGNIEVMEPVKYTPSSK
jgi:hypothetical protein